MKKIVALIVSLATPAWSTCSMVHHTNGCLGSTSPCALTVPSTTAGNLLIGTVSFPATGKTITSITGGTSVHPAGCAGSSSSNSSDVAYILSATGGTTSVTFTASATMDFAELTEYNCTSTPVSFDVCSNRFNSTGAANVAGVSAGTLTGTNDVILQYGAFTGNASVCPNSAANPADFPNGNATCGLINTTNNAAGTYTNTSSAVALGSIAFKEAAASSTAATNKRRKLMNLGEI